MQNAQEINWWVILLPSLVVGLFAVIVQILLAYWLSKVSENYKKDLSKEIEDYKKELNKELENYKIQLQAGFQTKLYEFQTRYSLIHQKKAEAIEKLFELLAKIQNDLQILTNWERANQLETREDFYLNARKDLNNLSSFFDEKRIYFDSDTQIETVKVVGVASRLLRRLNFDKDFTESYPDLANNLQVQAGNILDQDIHPLMNHLENKFKKLLSAENPNFQIEKNNEQ